MMTEVRFPQDECSIPRGHIALERSVTLEVTEVTKIVLELISTGAVPIDAVALLEFILDEVGDFQSALRIVLELTVCLDDGSYTISLHLITLRDAVKALTVHTDIDIVWNVGWSIRFMH